MEFFGILYDIKNGKKVPYSKNYFDTLFAAKLEELSVKTLTGALPLTFRTSETALRSWTIYGNNTPHNYSAEGTLPLTFTTHTAGNADDWSISGNDENGSENLFDNQLEQGTIAAEGETSATNRVRYDLSVAVDANTTYSQSAMAVDSSKTLEFIAFGFTNAIWINLFIGWKPLDTAFNTGDCRLVRMVYRFSDNADITPSDVTNVMLTKGSTAPDHYIPYQQGVGERTEQFINCSTISGGVLNEYGEVFGADATTNIHADSGSISFTTVSAWRGIVTDYIDIKSDVNKITLTYSGDRASNWRFCFYDNSQTFISQSPDIDRQTRVVDIPNNTKYFRASAQFETAETYSLTSLSIIKGSTAPTTFIPYGYEIPLTVSQTGQPDKTVDIYIGDTPLTEGETVSKTSTGVDLELFEGENTITTDLYNKPSMSIEGVDYVGVGEPINDSWQIPLTVSDGTNTATVNVPIDAPLTEGQSVTDTLTISTFEGANTIDTTLTNKPNMSITYKGG